MHVYSSREVAGLSELPVGQIRSFVRSGVLEPVRGRRGEFRFSFQDLVLLRTAKRLIEVERSCARVRRLLERVQEFKPASCPMSAVTFTTREGQVIARAGQLEWVAESGQVLFPFEAGGPGPDITPILEEDGPVLETDGDDMDAGDWLEVGLELELSSPRQARDAYRRALELEPTLLDARLNLARLLYTSGEFLASEAHCRIALKQAPRTVTAHFYLGRVLEELSRNDEARSAYRAAIRVEPLYKDAYYALAELLTRIGLEKRALRVLSEYRRRTRDPE